MSHGPESRNVEYERLASEARNHPGFLERERIRAIERMTRDVVGQNLVELVALLEQAERRQDLAMILMSNTPRFERDRDVLIGEITRLLHNFLNSASSLVDHVRRLTKGRDGLSGTNLKAGVADLMSDGAWPFIKDLRNFTDHYRLPLLGHTVRMGQTALGLQVTSAAIQLSRHDLIAWDRWSSPAQRFLRSCDEEIPLRELVHRVGQALINVHGRLVDDLLAENADAARDYNDLVVRLTAVDFGGDEHLARQFLEALHRDPDNHD